MEYWQWSEHVKTFESDTDREKFLRWECKIANNKYLRTELMIAYKARVIGVVCSVNDCINAGVGHKIDPVVDGDLWLHFKTKASTRTTEKPYLAIVGWKDLETSERLVPTLL